MAWRSLDGAAWEPVSQGGFGSADNTGLASAAAVISNGRRLFVVTSNAVGGPQLWSYLP